jgi:predicted RNA-binding protein with PUA-like domain
MNHWLMKTEPEEFSWDDLVKRGAKGEPWTGVRNFTARGHMKEMKKGDLVFIYHTGTEKQIVGVGEVIKEHYRDPTDASNVFVATDVIAKQPLKTPVTLATIKATGASDHAAGEIFAAVGDAGHRHRVGADLQDGRHQGIVPIGDADGIRRPQ